VPNFSRSTHLRLHLSPDLIVKHLQILDKTIETYKNLAANSHIEALAYFICIDNALK
jgi:hypothetical protein